MPVNRITTEASALIQAEKAAGKTSRDIAAAVNDQLGIALDQRSISRHLARLEGKTQKRKPKAPKKASAKPTAPKSAGRKAKAAAPLDEIPTLEARAVALKTQLDNSAKLTPPDIAKLNAELRQTFAAIRKAKDWGSRGKTGTNQDTAWVIAKLQRLAASTAEDVPAVDVEEPRRANSG
jgi:hypothetical protein